MGIWPRVNPAQYRCLPLGTHVPKPAEPRSPDVQIGEALARRRAPQNFGPIRTPSQLAANCFTKLKFEAAAIQPPYRPYPAPKLTTAPQAPREADFRRAAEADVDRQKEFGATENAPVACAQMRRVLAGELGGAWGRFGELGPQRANVAGVALLSMAGDQATATWSMEAQNVALRKLGRDRCDTSQIAQE